MPLPRNALARALTARPPLGEVIRGSQHIAHESSSRHMHVSSFDNLRRCVKKHVLADPVLSSRSPLAVLDVRSPGAEGSFRPLFSFEGCEYSSVDVGAGDSLDVSDESVDVVVASGTLARSDRFWDLFAAMTRACRTDGIIVVLVPRTPNSADGDRYGFLAASFDALAAATGTHVVDSWVDRRGPSHDAVAVFRRTPAAERIEIDHTTYMPLLDGALQNEAPPEEIPEHELNAGAMMKLPWLRLVHAALEPRYYFEVGVFDGASLRLTNCPAVGVDPSPIVRHPLKEFQQVHVGISADFFAEPSLTGALGPLDLSYVDGMHLIENAFEDFVNVEALSHPCSMILVDDIYPNHPQQGLRSRASRHWTGDVWKIIDILRTRRPDLILLPVDTFPTGTLVVIGANPHDTTLWDDYDTIIAEAIAATEIPPAEILERHGALHPEDPLLFRIMRTLRDLRELPDPQPGLDRLRQLVAGAFPRTLSTSSAR